VRVAIDATYSVDPEPSGVGVYSRELLRDLPLLYPDDEFVACIRPKQWWAHRRSRNHLPNLETRLLARPVPVGRSDLFHALNQRVDWRPARSVITTFHDLFVLTAEYSTSEFRARFAAQARAAAERSDLIIAVSRFTARQVETLLNVEPARIRVIYHGVHQCKFDFAVPRERIILFVGTLQTRKNISRLVDAFEQTPKDWSLVLAGSPHGYGAAPILARIDSSPRRSDISLMGYVTETERQRLFARASIFAFPSLDEGFGMPILEAMRFDLPVMTSRRSATEEVAGDAALLVDPESSEEIATALVQLCEDPQLRESLAAKGRERAAHFPWSRAARETYQVYQEVYR
jgi:glycosyltransferase involved in cell wall biosynthesis